MKGVEKIDKRGMYGAERETRGMEYGIIEGLRSKEEIKRLREGIGKEEEKMKVKMKAKMNIRARNKLLDILNEKGIEIEDLEEAIEEAYENYCEGTKEQ